MQEIVSNPKIRQMIEDFITKWEKVGKIGLVVGGIVVI